MRVRKEALTIIACAGAAMLVLSGCSSARAGSKAASAAASVKETESTSAAAGAEADSVSAAAVTGAGSLADASSVTEPASGSSSAAESIPETAFPDEAEKPAGSAPESVQEEVPVLTPAPTPKPTPAAADVVTREPVRLDPAWLYADHSKINTGTATLYHARPSIAKGKTVCINAGHGTEGGSSVKTLCHPDGTPKVTGGTTEAGATEAVAVSSGMDFLDGTPEREVTVALALVVKDTLLKEGYDVLMIRESADIQLDNVARTVIANNRADCHIALHYDGTESDKGVFFFSVPSDSTYRSMEPVASHWMDHNRLGENIVKGIEAQGFHLFDGGSMEMDLTQTSYSTVPSIDLEVGDAASDHSGVLFPDLARGIAAGLNSFFLFPA